LKLFGIRQLLVYVNDANILIGSVHNTKANTEAFLVGNKEIGLEVSADENKYMVTSRDHNEGRSHSIKINNRSFERPEQLKGFGKTLTNQNSIQEEIKSRLKSRNACFHSV
jgi:hypothetical protein